MLHFRRYDLKARLRILESGFRVLALAESHGLDMCMKDFFF